MHIFNACWVGYKASGGNKRRPLLKENRRPAEIFSRRPSQNEYALFPGDAPQSSVALHGYVRQSIEYVLTLPKPKRKQN